MARILVVEPDWRIGSFIAGILGDFGHQVERCDDLAQVDRRLRRERFDVIASDLLLDGCALAPSLPVLTLTGHPARPSTAPGEPPPRLKEKPFRFADLGRLVAAVAATAADRSLAA